MTLSTEHYYTVKSLCTVQTLHNLCDSYVLEVLAQVSFSQVRFESTCAQLYRSPAKIQTPNTVEHDQLQHHGPSACVITLQYSSTTFASLRFQFHTTKKLGVHLKNVNI
jgi:hypothetical protein